MHQRKKKQSALPKLMFTAGLLLMCMILMVGLTWARYQEEEINSLQYGVREPASVSLWSDYDEVTGTLTEGECSWTFSDGMGTLRFYISNNTAETDYSDEDVSVSIRLLGTLSITDAQVYLSVSDGSSTTTWAATPVQIKEGTPLFDTFGGGNAYVFQDENGSELCWTLKGGSLSVLSVQIDVLNLEQIKDAALLQLQVVGK